MKKIYRDAILNVEGTDPFDSTFVFEYCDSLSPNPSQREGRSVEIDTYEVAHLTRTEHRLPYNRELDTRRKELKKNLTVYEKKAWKEIFEPLQRKYGIRVLQQRIIGDFIVDFYVASLGLVIEIDGESRFAEDGGAYDTERTSVLNGYGLQVLRFTNQQIRDDVLGVQSELERYFELPLSLRGARGEIQIIYLRELLESRKNPEILERVKEKPAMWSEVYSPKDELEIFTEIFESALREKRRVHVVGVTLGEEIQMLEEYYESLGFMREDINAFDVDFSQVYISASCHIENLMWKGSDYKAQREKIFFNPPIRESGQNKALFKGITRGVLAGIELGDFTPDKQSFIRECIVSEKILPLHMGKVLCYNLEDIGIVSEKKELKVHY